MQQTIFAPYLRTSPVHIPRRDLVLYSSDSLSLRVTVVESDNPAAAQLVLTGGIGGPVAQLVIWANYHLFAGQYGSYGYSYSYGWGYDYGRPPTPDGTVLWSSAGVPQIGLGSFDFFIPADTLMSFPQRCSWGVQLNWTGQKSDLLYHGTMNIHGGARFGAITVPADEQYLLTDDYIPVLEDDNDPVQP
ncbi:MAG TPA: hypothetical protein VGI78_02330 [Acetobacteraceae bacterium]|jgi:hypothetical protein